MMAQTLITGGAGFIGYQICDKLLKFGHEVLCVNNFFTGSCQNIAQFIHDKK